jgi:hypothetical protein
VRAERLHHQLAAKIKLVDHMRKPCELLLRMPNGLAKDFRFVFVYGDLGGGCTRIENEDFHVRASDMELRLPENFVK